VAFSLRPISVLAECWPASRPLRSEFPARRLCGFCRLENLTGHYARRVQICDLRFVEALPGIVGNLLGEIKLRSYVRASK
jgi:hypothetical protein